MESMLKRELKSWQKEFKAKHGREPTRSDIQKHPKIAATYDTWQAIQDANAENPAKAKKSSASGSKTTHSKRKAGESSRKINGEDDDRGKGEGSSKRPDADEPATPRKSRSNPFRTPTKPRYDDAGIAATPSRNPFATPAKRAEKGKERARDDGTSKSTITFEGGKAYQSPSHLALLTPPDKISGGTARAHADSAMIEWDKSVTGGFTTTTPRAARIGSQDASYKDKTANENPIYVSPRLLRSPSKLENLLADSPSKAKTSPTSVFKAPQPSHLDRMLMEWTPRTKARKRLRGEDVTRTPGHKRRRNLAVPPLEGDASASAGSSALGGSRKASFGNSSSGLLSRGRSAGHGAWARTLSGKDRAARLVDEDESQQDDADEELDAMGATPPPADASQGPKMFQPLFEEESPSKKKGSSQSRLPRGVSSDSEANEDAEDGQRIELVEDADMDTHMEIDEDSRNSQAASQREKAASKFVEAELSGGEDNGKSAGTEMKADGSKIKLKLAPYMLYGRASDKLRSASSSDDDDFSYPLLPSPEKRRRAASPQEPEETHLEEGANSENEEGERSASHFAGLSINSPRAAALRARRRAAEQRYLENILAVPKYDEAFQDIMHATSDAGVNGDHAPGSHQEGEAGKGGSKMSWGAAKAKEQANAPKKGKGKGRATDAEGAGTSQKAQAKGKPVAESSKQTVESSQPKPKTVFSRAGRAGIADDEVPHSEGHDLLDAPSESGQYSDDDWASEVDDFDYGLGDGLMDSLDEE